MDTKKKLIKNFLSLSGAEIIGRAFGVVLSIYIARSFGPTVYGQVAFATAFISFFNIFADFGLTTLGIREIAKDKEKTISWGTNILIFQTVLSVILYLILIFATIFLDLTFTLKVIVLIFGLGIIPTAFDMSYIFQAHERMEYIPVVRILSQFGYLLLGFILLYFSKNIISIPIASTVSLFITAIVAFILLRSKLHFHFEKIDLKQMKVIIITAIPFVTAALLTTIYHNLDSVFIQFLSGSKQVGYYNTGYKIVNLALVFIVFAANVFFPFISNSFEKSIENFKKHTIAFSKVMGILSLPVTFGGISFAGELILFLYGNKFIESIFVFKFLLVLVPLIALNVVISNIIVAAGFQKQNTISIAIGAAINLILNFILIPQFGMVGAAYATIIAEGTVCLYLIGVHFIKLKNTIFVLESFFLKPLIASACILLIPIFDHFRNTLLDLALAGFVYVVVLICIKGIPRELLTDYLKINLNGKKA